MRVLAFLLTFLFLASCASVTAQPASTGEPAQVEASVFGAASAEVSVTPDGTATGKASSEGLSEGLVAFLGAFFGNLIDKAANFFGAGGPAPTVVNVQVPQPEAPAPPEE